MLNFVSLLGPVHSGGVNLCISAAIDWKSENFALISCLVGKVRSLEIYCKMGFAEFFLIKQLLMKNAIDLHLSEINNEVCMFCFYIIFPHMKKQNFR